MNKANSPEHAGARVIADWIMQSNRVAAITVPTLMHAIVISALFGAVDIVNAQSTQKAAGDSSIAYRLLAAKTMHFDDAKKASQHLAAVKKLGCEVTQDDHERHGDVIYRCPKWKALTVANDRLAHQWEEWLKDAGFETLHGHAFDEHHDHHGDEAHNHAEEHAHEHGNETGKHEEVSYRLPNWAVLHPQKQDETQELIAIVKGLGCEVREDRHEGHQDVSIRCVERKHIELPSHKTAETWQKWMAAIGFETRHED